MTTTTADLMAQVALARATELARAGAYDEALRLLEGAERTAFVLDLTARIAAQRGQSAEARRLWTAVLERDPGYPGAKEGLTWLDAPRRRVGARVAVPVLLLAAAIVAAAVVAGFFTRQVGASVQDQLTTIEDRLQRRIAELKPPPPGPAAPVLPASPAPPRRPVLPVISVPDGVVVRAEAGFLVASFSDALFLRGVIFAPGAKERITALGVTLEPHVGEVRFEIIGHSDATPIRSQNGPFLDNGMLAMSRAAAVLDQLASTTRLPSTLFTLRSMGGKAGPFADRPEDPRNRTVVVRIVPISRPEDD